MPRTPGGPSGGGRAQRQNTPQTADTAHYQTPPRQATREDESLQADATRCCKHTDALPPQRRLLSLTPRPFCRTAFSLHVNFPVGFSGKRAWRVSGMLLTGSLAPRYPQSPALPCPPSCLLTACLSCPPLRCDNGLIPGRTPQASHMTSGSSTDTTIESKMCFQFLLSKLVSKRLESKHNESGLT